MPALSIQIPYPIFSDSDGQPLDNGYVWIGQAYLDPQTNPVQVYLDEALTIPVAQPLRTIGGYVSNSGSPAQLYIDGVNFSIRVQDSKGTQVYYFPDGSGINPDAAGVTYNPGPDSLLLPGGPISVKAALDEITDDGTNANGAALISFLQAGTDAVPRTVQSKLRDVVSVKDFGAVGDGVTDDTAAIQAAIDASPTLPLFFPAGNYRITNTLFPQNTTKFVGEDGATGAFAAFVSRITFDPPAVAKATLAANINTTVTTISLVNASAFPNSGIIYLDTVNGEYVKYTGKSGNDLTGCIRGYWGGTGATSGVSPSGVGDNYLAGVSVWLLRPVMMRDGVFSGTIQNLSIYRAGFVSNNVGWADLGLAFYFNYSAYGTILRDSLIFGFEKAGYCGRAYVTNLEHPMLYSCLYGVQMDTPNGSVISDSDSGDIGSATLTQIGWAYYLKNGEGCFVSGGSLGNGEYNRPIISDGCKPVQVTGIYAEAHKVELLRAINGGIIYANGVYSKESTFRLASIATDGKIYVENIYHRDTGATDYVFNTDNTGSWSIKNSYNGTTSAYDPDKYGIGTARYVVPSFTQSTSPILAAEQRGVKAVPDNTATPIFKIRTLADGTQTDIQVGLTVDYFLAGNFGSGGAVSEKGLIEIAIHHRQTLAPDTALTVVGATQVTVVGTTRTTTFTIATALVTTNTYETTVSVTSVASNAAASNLTYVVKPSNLNLVSSTGRGLLTIL